jgi:hypothetical protein
MLNIIRVLTNDTAFIALALRFAFNKNFVLELTFLEFCKSISALYRKNECSMGGLLLGAI